MGFCGYMRASFVLRLKQIDGLIQYNSQRCTNVAAKCMRLGKEVRLLAGMTTVEGFNLSLPSVSL